MTVQTVASVASVIGSDTANRNLTCQGHGYVLGPISLSFNRELSAALCSPKSEVICTQPVS